MSWSCSAAVSAAVVAEYILHLITFPVNGLHCLSSFQLARVTAGVWCKCRQPCAVAQEGGKAGHYQPSQSVSVSGLPCFGSDPAAAAAGGACAAKPATGEHWDAYMAHHDWDHHWYTGLQSLDFQDCAPHSSCPLHRSHPFHGGEPPPSDTMHAALHPTVESMLRLCGFPNAYGRMVILGCYHAHLYA